MWRWRSHTRPTGQKPWEHEGVRAVSLLSAASISPPPEASPPANTSMNAVVSPPQSPPTHSSTHPHPHALVVWQQQRRCRNVCRTTWHTYQSVKVLCCYCAKSQWVHAALCLRSVYFSGTGSLSVTHWCHTVSSHFLPLRTQTAQRLQPTAERPVYQGFLQGSLMNKVSFSPWLPNKTAGEEFMEK